VISRLHQEPWPLAQARRLHRQPEWQKVSLLKYTNAAAITTGVYSDPDVKKKVPYADQLLQALQQAKSRPVSPVNNQISQAIYKNVNDALAGRVSPKDALAKGRQADLERPLDVLI
jgi:multiple sugar transport system substrate-binding protein